MGRKLLIGMVTILLVIGSAPAASAAEVGASGECYDKDGTGGGTSTSAGTNGVTLLDAVNAVNAVVTLVTDSDGNPDVVSAAQGNGCTRYDCGSPPTGEGTDCDQDDDGDSKPARKDYLEVHAEGGGQTVQVCYDGNPHAGPSQNCAYEPAGPGDPGAG